MVFIKAIFPKYAKLWTLVPRMIKSGMSSTVKIVANISYYYIQPKEQYIASDSVTISFVF